MNAQELKAKLIDDDIIHILTKLGATIYLDDENTIVSDTICHGGSSPKLYYYKDSYFNRSKHDTVNIFHCYTDCNSSFDVIELVCKVKEYTFYEGITWICVLLGFSTLSYGFYNENDNEIITDWKFINEIQKRKRRENETKGCDYYDKNILNIFQKMYTQSWIDEGISIETMYKYNIQYSTLQQRIIIPHYSVDNELLGIRTRTTSEYDEVNYGKYTPLHIGKITYSHPLGQYLYGLNFNIEAIKRKRKIMIVESEKAVMQCDTMFDDDNFTVALCGKNFTNYHRDLIIDLDVREVIIALDKQYVLPTDSDADIWAKHIREKLINKLAPYFIVTVLWDSNSVLPYKASPTDCGKTTLLKLMDEKIYVGCK